MADCTPEAEVREAWEARRLAKIQEQEEDAKRLEREAVEKLRDKRESGNLAICAGSGVTLFSTRNNDGSNRTRLTWKGFIQNGLDYIQREKPSFYRGNQKAFEKATNALDDTDSTVEDVLEVAGKVTRFMDEHSNFADWLSTQFERLHDYVEFPAILDSLGELQRAGVTLMTTNYDGLIESHCGLQPLDGSQPQDLVRFGRRELPNVVFHPHGYWKNRNHVVLDLRQYYEVQREDSRVRQTLYDMLRGRTVVFVGCGGGVADPNFGSLLKWLCKQEEDVSHGHYILLKKGENHPEVDKLPLKKVYLETFDDIAPWLDDLLLDPSGSSDGNSE
ncbi:SIR2-like domain-containing protein [Penicillium verhagenii]|uniref:SIR2-like domain-containing protein n=1 Tax=Penicillium verhagenii TaxID=1562060 RepID=UPI002545957E|nr:SIR2-like domain-containing protein [Penicillium verhagenii]KAJ5938325.1 SIR2-like domain-containing protein [Penicillium verhagenii]